MQAEIVSEVFPPSFFLVWHLSEVTWISLSFKIEKDARHFINSCILRWSEASSGWTDVSPRSTKSDCLMNFYILTLRFEPIEVKVGIYQCGLF